MLTFDGIVLFSCTKLGVLGGRGPPTGTLSSDAERFLEAIRRGFFLGGGDKGDSESTGGLA